MERIVTKLIEIWDDDCGWKQFCDACGRAPERKITELPCHCNFCGAELLETERC